METFCLTEKSFDWKAAIGAVAKTHQPGILKKLNRCVTTVTIPEYVPWNVNLGSSVIGQHLFFANHGNILQNATLLISLSMSIPLIPPPKVDDIPLIQVCHCSPLRESQLPIAKLSGFVWDLWGRPLGNVSSSGA